MPAQKSPIPYSQDTETIPPDEAQDIQRVMEAIQVLLTRGWAKSGTFRGDVHVKTHGYAQGEFRVLPNLPSELAQGLFQRDRTCPAIVRFSNSASRELADALPDGRGMSIKLTGIDGELLQTEGTDDKAQDFLMINHPVFFASNAKDFLRLEQVLVNADEQVLATATGALAGETWNPLHWHWREMLTVTRIASHLPAHPANNTYFSMTPIRYGDYVAKYRVRPVGTLAESYLQMLYGLSTQADAMRLALEQTLQQQEILFEFQVQLRNSESTMPIEDACVVWPESESPFRTVAHLLLPRQEIESLRHQAAFQNLAFNVWHGLAAHRPLGGINRVRRFAYPCSAAWRRKQETSQTSSKPETTKPEIG